MSDFIMVYTTDSGLGGSFTVSIERQIDPEHAEVRIWYGRATERGWESWRDFDGCRFTARLTDLRNPRLLVIHKKGIQA